MDYKRANINATGHVCVVRGRFVPGVVLEINGCRTQGLVPEEAFDTAEACRVFLKEELKNIVQRLCGKLGYEACKITYSVAGDLACVQ